jgi:hypothetical protein
MATIYVEGIRSFPPRENAPDFVIGNGVITPRQLMDFFKKAEVAEHYTEYKGDKQVKFQVLKGRDGSLNFVIDTFKPDSNAGSNDAANDEADLPF